MGQTTASQLQASKLPSHCNMKPLIILALVALSRSQYSGETQDLSNSQLDALKDIFGDAAGGGAYSGQQVGRLEGGTNGVEAIIQVVKNKGIKAQETLNKYSQCNVFWQPIDAAPLTTGGNGYVDGGDVDISGFERVGPSVAQTSDSSAVKLTQGSSY